MSVAQLLRATRVLPSDKPVVDAKKWYRTQKEHWIGWLREYNGPGAYGRKTNVVRDARYAYNHIVEPKMLIWLIEAAAVETSLVIAAWRALAAGKSMPESSAMIRRAVPWNSVEQALLRGARKEKT